MRLELVPAAMVDRAWQQGASSLAEACDTSGGEVTGDQLKLLLMRGERQLVKLELNGPVGWGVIRVDQLPNVRALHICEMYAPGIDWPSCFEQLKDIARNAGCTEIRCSAKETQARLYRRHHDWEPLYTTMRVKI